MSKTTKDYSIRTDYQENPVQNTYDLSGDPSYWNAKRLDSAASYQWDVYEAAANLMRENGFTRLLDVGCGPPVKLRALMPSGLDICLVNQPNLVSHASQLLPAARFYAANLECDLPALEESFDLVLCADVIEHLIDPDPCLDFMKRHLAPGGLLLISTPERHSLRGKDCTRCSHPMHVREWSFDEFVRFLSSRGLKVVDHRLLPQQRTNAARKAWGELLVALCRPPPWYSCQLAICRAQN